MAGNARRAAWQDCLSPPSSVTLRTRTRYQSITTTPVAFSLPRLRAHCAVFSAQQLQRIRRTTENSDAANGCIAGRTRHWTRLFHAWRTRGTRHRTYRGANGRHPYQARDMSRTATMALPATLCVMHAYHEKGREILHTPTSSSLLFLSFWQKKGGQGLFLYLSSVCRGAWRRLTRAADMATVEAPSGVLLPIL